MWPVVRRTDPPGTIGPPGLLCVRTYTVSHECTNTLLNAIIEVMMRIPDIVHENRHGNQVAKRIFTQNSGAVISVANQP